ncbi:hypothetical protein L228DRAFT_252555 [Xylona heveae TC161]|uniref:Thioredoxin domain-containing protein n=1 Tax=Xylona heveae (strain CBS 132557 / TC161) TaxID=1328760 RepID=A0A165HXA0_XYLHT|nr:hypothetical protein L228DRAFT_252555 [Xylona heveae TC161]KZF24058.1 hypothetical protein L228DRAFT_252555 [Xylona heveae TC161]
MTLRQELASWKFPQQLQIAQVPNSGTFAPSSDQIPLPPPNGKPTVITFLRHCGCPFAEKAFLDLRTTASANPSVNFIAVSHSDAKATEKWINALGGSRRVQVIVDADRQLYTKWGLGVASFWHLLNPQSMWGVYQLASHEGIWNRPTESGTRWQTAGSFAVDKKGHVCWSRPALSAHEVPNFDEAVKAMQ